jgi:hypothetical protein
MPPDTNVRSRSTESRGEWYVRWKKDPELVGGVSLNTEGFLITDPFNIACESWKAKHVGKQLRRQEPEGLGYAEKDILGESKDAKRDGVRVL